MAKRFCDIQEICEPLAEAEARIKELERELHCARCQRSMDACDGCVWGRS